eukprot:767229_1
MSTLASIIVGLHVLSSFVSAGYEGTLYYLCPTEGIPPAKVPFTDGDLNDVNVINWINNYFMCTVAYVNDIVTFPQTIKSIVTDQSEKCSDGICAHIASCAFQKEAVVFANYFNTVKDEFEITAVTEYSFTISSR